MISAWLKATGFHDLVIHVKVKVKASDLKRLDVQNCKALRIGWYSTSGVEHVHVRLEIAVCWAFHFKLYVSENSSLEIFT